MFRHVRCISFVYFSTYKYALQVSSTSVHKLYGLRKHVFKSTVAVAVVFVSSEHNPGVWQCIGLFCDETDLGCGRAALGFKSFITVEC